MQKSSSWQQRTLKFTTSLLLTCLPLAACSTAPAMPFAALLQPCDPPQVVRSETMWDVMNNSNQRQLAYEQCAARHKALADAVR